MEQLFSANSEETINRKLNINLHKGPFSDEDLDFYFDINNLVKWINLKNFKRIALQFPDELLNYSIKVNARLKLKCESDCVFFILGDTSYGSCCVDLIAAEHYNADSIVHFGHSCLSLVEKLPVFYVFEKLPLDLDSVKTEIESLVSQNKSETIIILYDVAYYYLYDSLFQLLSNNPNVYLSNIHMSGSEIKYEKNDLDSKLLFSRLLPKELSNKETRGSYLFFYIGTNESFLNQFLFYFNKNKFYNYNPNSNSNELVKEISFSRTNRDLMKRYYLIEKARDARIFGILIGTMSVVDYKQAIDHVSNILRKAQRRFYSFLIGKLNCPKLNNFLEVDMYVLIACNENSLINSKELNKPIITLYELEIAFNSARLWGEEFICDYHQLLNGNEHYVSLKLTDQESDVSLITGETRILNFGRNNEKENENSSLIPRDEALSVIHHSGAGEFLQKRSWIGLEQNFEKTEVTKSIEGTKGIAMNYESEPIKIKK